MNLKYKHPSLLASVGFVALLSLAQADVASAQIAPDLGTATSFAVLGGSTVTNTGNTVIYGDVGVWPGLSITGFYPPGTVVPPGTFHAGDAVAQEAQEDLTTAYNDIGSGNQPCPPSNDLTGTDLGTLGPLGPGVYCFSTSAQLTGTLTLAGSVTDVWIFQIGSTLTTASSSAVAFTGGADPCNVFWQVGTSATLGTGTAFAGNILALASITMNTSATLDGRALARNGAVTLDTNTTDATVCPAVPPPGGVGVLKVFNPPTINVGGSSTLTITFTNTSATAATLSTDFTDTLPSNVVTTGLPSTTCGGTPPTATASTVTLPAGATIPGGSVATPGFCTVTIGVTGTTVGSFVNTLGPLVTDQGESPEGPGARLDVTANVPVLSTRALVMLGALLALLGLVAIRRLGA